MPRRRHQVLPPVLDQRPAAGLHQHGAARAGLSEQQRPVTVQPCSYATPARSAAGPGTDSTARASIGSTGGLSVTGPSHRSQLLFQGSPDQPEAALQDGLPLVLPSRWGARRGAAPSRRSGFGQGRAMAVVP